MRGEKVIVDFDLAMLYGVETAQLKRAVRRDIEKRSGKSVVTGDNFKGVGGEGKEEVRKRGVGILPASVMCWYAPVRRVALVLLVLGSGLSWWGEGGDECRVGELG